MENEEFEEFESYVEYDDDEDDDGGGRGLALVKGHENLLKDEDTGAVVNTDESEYEAYLARREVKWREEKEKNDIKFDIEFLKTAVLELQQKVRELQNESR